jgi:hypothetical protein
LTEDKAYADTAKLAKPLDAAGVVDTGADAFYVLDAVGRHYGKAPTGGDRGYQGTAILATDDHSGGVPGYRIIEMEGPAHLMTGVLNGSYSGGGTPFTPSTTQIWGRAQRGRRFPATGDITVMDDDGVASGGQTGDKWLIAWNEAAANYSFVVSMDSVTQSLIIGLIVDNIDAAAMDGTAVTITPGITADSVYKMTWDGVGLEGVGAAIHGVNLSKTALRATTAEPLACVGYLTNEIYEIEEAFVVTGLYDLRMLPGFVDDEVILPGFDVGTNAELLTIEEWINKLSGYSSGVNQSIGHDSSDVTEWQNDDDCA